MTIWTFTTSDPTEAHKLSLFCLTEGMHGTAETRDDTTSVAKRAPAKRKAIARDGWTDKEARKTLTKVRGWIDARLRKDGGPISYSPGPEGEFYAYAAALGVSPEVAAEKINRHREYLSMFKRSGGMLAR